MTLSLVKSHETAESRFRPLADTLESVQVETGGFDAAVELARQARKIRAEVYFIGNGGSAAIASHMAADYLKNGGFVATAFNDASMLTCLTNDLGYASVFSKQLEAHAVKGDLLFAISSSGRSINITSAVWKAKKLGVDVVTLSGFDPANPLRELGRINFYVPSHKYGLVEISHLAILHGILDRVMDGS